jgi:hypothetical protein
MPLTAMGVELALYSWETMARRWMLMASGQCPPAEYQAMVAEKAQAMGQAAVSLALRGPADVSGMVTPFHKIAVANAKRLRHG